MFLLNLKRYKMTEIKILQKDNKPQKTFSIGIYIDLNNIKSNGGDKMQYDVLIEYALRNGGYVNSMNVYMSKPINHETDKENDFKKIIKRIGYNIVYADTKIFEQENDQKPIIKQNADVMIATDMMNHQDNIDRYLILTGDGDFSYTIKQLIKNGKYVEVVAFSNVSRDLKECCNIYQSGYLIPNLLFKGKSSKNKPTWGDTGSRVRGYIHKVYGTYSFAYFYKKINDKMWIISNNHPENSLESVFVPHIELIGENITDENRKDGCIYEFTLEENENKQDSTKEMTDLVATKVKRIEGAFI